MRDKSSEGDVMLFPSGRTYYFGPVFSTGLSGSRPARSVRSARSSTRHSSTSSHMESEHCASAGEECSNNRGSPIGREWAQAITLALAVYAGDGHSSYHDSPLLNFSCLFSLTWTSSPSGKERFNLMHRNRITFFQLFFDHLVSIKIDLKIPTNLGWCLKYQ